MTSFFKSPALPLALALSTACAPALADSGAGLYASGALGFNDLQTETITGVGAPFGPQPGGNTKTDNGGAGLLALGWNFGNGIRVELEGGYRRNGFNHATAGAQKNADATGDQDKTTVFVNAYHDFPKLSFGVAPYVGLGAGHSKAKWSDMYITQGNEVVHFNDSVGSRAYQLILGATLLENLVPGLSLTIEYRYLSTEGATHSGAVEKSRFGAFPVTATINSTRDQSLLVGLSYRFKGL
jgi:opacity protein-like surface antigen